VRRPLLFAAAAATAIAGVGGAASAATQRVVFTGDWEGGGTSQWADCQSGHDGAIKVGSQRVRQGRLAARFEVTDADADSFGDRVECQASTGESEGQVRTYRWSTYFPAAFPLRNADSWATFTQWHCTCSGSPTLGMFLQGRQIQLRVLRYDGEGDTAEGELIPWGRALTAVRGKWTDFTMRVRWSSSDATGFVELWVNGKRQSMNWPRDDDRAARYGGVGATRVPIRTLVPGQGAYLKQGLYRSSSINGRAVLFHDGMRMTAG
jgi:Polysaccharide lyase